MRAHARGQAGRRADPVRRRRPTARSFRTSSGTFPAAACGSRRRRAAIDEAVKRNVFARSLKREVRAAADLGATVERQLRARGARCARHRPQGRPGRDRLRPDRSRACRRSGGGDPAVPRTASPDGARKIAAAAARRQTGENAGRNPGCRGVYDRRNWIWHWGGQMWYMLPCSPAQRATGSLRAARASNASGRSIRADAARDSACVLMCFAGSGSDVNGY